MNCSHHDTCPHVLRLPVAGERCCEATLELSGGRGAVAELAHELGTPLGYLMANLCFARSEAAELGRIELVEALAEAEEGARQVLAIVRDLQAGQALAAAPSADPLVVIEGAIRMAAPQLRPRARIVRELVDVLPPVAIGETALHRIILNLLTNASRALQDADPGLNAVTVRAELRSHRVAIQVRDTGVGIPYELQHRIFEPGFTTRLGGEGSGLGLSICRDLVQAAGGCIRVESAPGVGTVFLVELPIAA